MSLPQQTKKVLNKSKSILDLRFFKVANLCLDDQTVSGVTTICLMQGDTSPSHWSGCWLWPGEWCPTPLQWLCEVAGHWLELEHTVIHIDPEHPKHAQWVTCLVTMQANYAGKCSASRIYLQILATWGCALSFWNMGWRQRMNSTTMGLRISSRIAVRSNCH